MKRLILACLCLLPLTRASAEAPAQTLSIRFLTIQDGKKVLTEGPEKSYFDTLQLGELRAKSRLALQASAPEQARALARAKFADDVQAYSAEEQAMLREVLARLAPRIQRDAPLLARTPFCFIKTGTNVEAGIPHTRGACIVLAPTELDGMLRMYRWGWTTILDQMAAPLLIHEQVHVLQRAYPERFVSLYTEMLGFRHLDTLPDHPWLIEHRMSNPDAPDLRWIYKLNTAGKEQWIRADLMLRELVRPNMADDTRPVAIELIERNGTFMVAQDGKGQPRMRDLNSVSEYKDLFPNRTENYHPNEISADLIAGWISTHPEGNANHVLRRKIAAWGAKNLQ
ncbi:hypothetical protein [Pseudoduganella danionis]|uniref:hypothetical protein n=1 Tax=Pseudoduganella danionis TaxID=1890295 RepID=UPI0035B4D926